MNLKNDIAIFFLAIVCCIGCLHEPVDSDYYDDLSLVKGGEKPTPPVDLSLTVADHEVTLQFYTDRLDSGNPVTYDPDTGTNENLYYLVYIASQDPATFDVPELYYDIRYYLGYVAEIDFAAGVDPKEVSIAIASSYHGPLFVWMTSHDGGRESDHSEVVSVVIP